MPDAAAGGDPISQMFGLCRLSDTPAAKRWQRIAEPLFPQSEVVKIPWLLPDVPDKLMETASPKSSEWRFSVNLREVVDPSRSTFAICKGETGERLFKLSLAAGGMLAIAEDGKDPDLILRSGSGNKRMLTVMEGNGSYFGKIEVLDDNGLVLYHKQKPCATITADIPNLSMQVYPLSADAKFVRAASATKKGDKLRIQVAKKFDASLFLGCFLGIIMLEPELMAGASSL